MKAAPKYYSPLREAQAATTRAKILEACAAVMETGSDLTFSKVADAADVQERTIYRYFPTKADLEAGLWDWILEHLTHIDLKPKGEEDLIAAMRSSFKGFDDGAPLIRAMLHSRQGLEIRQKQQTERRAMFEACVAAAVPEAPPRIRTRAAAALQVLYSATAWENLRAFWGMDAAQAADVVEVAIRALLAGLRLGIWAKDEQPQKIEPPNHRIEFDGKTKRVKKHRKE